MRRIILELDQLTEDGEKEIAILTNLPDEVSAEEIARLYRSRWTIEAVFGELTLSLNGEIKTLG